MIAHNRYDVSKETMAWIIQ